MIGSEPPRLHLHARSITFPLRGRSGTHTVFAPLPPHMTRTFNSLCLRLENGDVEVKARVELEEQDVKRAKQGALSVRQRYVKKAKDTATASNKAQQSSRGGIRKDKQAGRTRDMAVRPSVKLAKGNGAGRHSGKGRNNGKSTSRSRNKHDSRSKRPAKR